jgi:hypothetical protein
MKDAVVSASLAALTAGAMLFTSCREQEVPPPAPVPVVVTSPPMVVGAEEDEMRTAEPTELVHTRSY